MTGSAANTHMHQLHHSEETRALTNNSTAATSSKSTSSSLTEHAALKWDTVLICVSFGFFLIIVASIFQSYITKKRKVAAKALEAYSEAKKKHKKQRRTTRDGHGEEEDEDEDPEDSIEARSATFWLNLSDATVNVVTFSGIGLLYGCLTALVVPQVVHDSVKAMRARALR